MNRKLIIRMLGSLLLIEAIAMLPSFLIALYYGDGDAFPLLYAILINIAVGTCMFFFFKPDQESHLRLKEGFDLEEYKRLFNEDFLEKYRDIVDDYLKRKLAVIRDGKFAFTDDGLIIMDSLILPLF